MMTLVLYLVVQVWLLDLKYLVYLVFLVLLVRLVHRLHLVLILFLIFQVFYDDAFYYDDDDDHLFCADPVVISNYLLNLTI